MARTLCDRLPPASCERTITPGRPVPAVGLPVRCTAGGPPSPSGTPRRPRAARTPQPSLPGTAGARGLGHAEVAEPALLFGVQLVPVPALGVAYHRPTSVPVPGRPRPDGRQAGAFGEVLREVGVVPLPVDGPSERPRVPVGVDRGEGGGPVAPRVRGLSEPSGRRMLVSHCPRGRVPRRSRGAVELVVGPRRTEVGLEASVGGIPHDPQLRGPLAGHGPGPILALLIGEPSAERERPRGLDVLVRHLQIPLPLPVPGRSPRPDASSVGGCWSLLLPRHSVRSP